MIRGALPLLLGAGLGLAASARAGHEIPFYPSFYPQEIQLEAMEPATAAKRLAAASLHAYVGADPFGGRPLPPGVRAVESLERVVVVTFNPKRAAWRDRERRCAAARALIGALAHRPAAYTFHPYPVTPYHPDYLEHFDRVGAARKSYEATTEATATAMPLRLRATGRVAGALVGSPEPARAADWDATVEDVELDTLVGPRHAGLPGWPGPPWLKAGWFQAYLLAIDTVADAAKRRRVEELHQRLVTGSYTSPTERVGIERQLVGELQAGCERLVIGYATRREPYSAEFSRGVENTGADSQDGFAGPVFVRTAKLKDFPWNGWLHLGAPGRPTSAWNPIGGFIDPASRLLWSAVGDPAFFPAPGSGHWLANRVAVESIEAGAPELEVAPDAWRADPATGLLQPAGPGRTAAVRIRYRVLNSAFQDGSRMTAADLLYPLAFAARWSGPGSRGPNERDPAVEAATALVRDRLVGVRPVRTDTQVRDFGDFKLPYAVQVVDVYLRRVSADQPGLAAIAPPWSTTPWHLTVLMEEAVRQGVGAFSPAEAGRRHVPWLDLVRDRRAARRLADILDGFERQAYVPPALAAVATAAEARARWSALQAFYRERGHLLVTNGPYRLERGSAQGGVLGVFRDLSYPLGVGTYDAYAVPRRAYVSRVETRDGRLEVTADIEVVEKVMRDVRLVREPLRDRPGGIDPADLPRCRYVVVGPEGQVVRAGTAPFVDPAVFAVPLDAGWPAGSYSIALTLALGDNELDPDVKVVQYRAP